mmetsp:Transcript_10043/g.24213  ORF Transcript_10043/g.24213 Transcript_10043/m.24213 type:complete len:89 (+) Transcript_10043:374-640(+)
MLCRVSVLLNLIHQKLKLPPMVAAGEHGGRQARFGINIINWPCCIDDFKYYRICHLQHVSRISYHEMHCNVNYVISGIIISILQSTLR